MRLLLHQHHHPDFNFINFETPLFLMMFKMILADKKKTAKDIYIHPKKLNPNLKYQIFQHPHRL